MPETHQHSQGVVATEPVATIEAVTQGWVLEKVRKATWKLIGSVAGTVVITIVVGVLQILSRQEAYERKQVESFSEFRNSTEKAMIELKGQVRIDVTALGGRIDKIESQISEVKEALRRIEGKLDKTRIAGALTDEPTTAMR